MKNAYHLRCNIAQTLNLIGDKWSLLILYSILCGNESYKELQQSLEGIPSNLLSERLKVLEEEKLIVSTLYQSHPPRYRYTLTECGRDLQDVFNSLILWGERHLKHCYKHLTHAECGGKVELHYYCTACHKEISAEDLKIASSESPQ